VVEIDCQTRELISLMGPSRRSVAPASRRAAKKQGPSRQSTLTESPLHKALLRVAGLTLVELDFEPDGVVVTPVRDGATCGPRRDVWKAPNSISWELFRTRSFTRPSSKATYICTALTQANGVKAVWQLWLWGYDAQERKAAGFARRVQDLPSPRELSSAQSAVAEARRALLQGEFCLWFQPKIDVRTGRLSGYEALARWKRGEEEILAPSRFAEAMNDNDFLKILGRFVLDQAIAQAQAWLQVGHDFGHIAINVSPAEVADASECFAQRIIDTISESDLDPSYIQIEMTEGVLLDDGCARVQNAFQKLKDAGLSIAFDDFGTGFASLSHLRQFQYDVLKIDSKFTTGIDEKEDARALLQAIISLARALGKTVVAEGIETPSQFDTLKELGCDYAQGYFLGKPAPAAEGADLTPQFQ
jgi:EAL domain-containing protein (putative c-di-GMP-specific phosphodiesterase class I)